MTIVLTMFSIKDLGATFTIVAQVLCSCNIPFSFNKIIDDQFAMHVN